MDRLAVFGGLRSLVADSLAISGEEIRLESRLTTDLGADSLDFIDIIFSIEKKFAIKLRDSELDFLSKLDFSSPKVMREGHLTREAVAALRTWLPSLDRLPDPDRITPAELFSCITIETLCLLVERKLGVRPPG